MKKDRARNCSYCDVTFVPSGRGVRADAARFCSKRCSSSSRGKPCSVIECGRKHYGHGLCELHLQRLRRHGDALYQKPTICSVDGCEKEPVGKGYCSMHWQRVKKYGEPGRAEPYTTSEVAERKRKHQWYLGNDGYIYTSRQGKKVGQHRVVMERMLGRPLERWENVHHRNGRRGDNASANLELWVVPQPAGQRVEDLVEFVVAHYEAEVREQLKRRSIRAVS